jgi:hypothetical protein
MSDERGEYGEDAEDAEDDAGSEWPVKGPATGQQAILAIGFVFFIGVVVGFLLCRTF